MERTEGFVADAHRPIEGSVGFVGNAIEVARHVALHPGIAFAVDMRPYVCIRGPVADLRKIGDVIARAIAEGSSETDGIDTLSGHVLRVERSE